MEQGQLGSETFDKTKDQTNLFIPHHRYPDTGGIILDQELCIPSDYKKATIPWTEDSNPFHINISIALTSLVKVSLESNSFSFYFSSSGEWRDPR